MKFKSDGRKVLRLEDGKWVEHELRSSNRKAESQAKYLNAFYEELEIEVELEDGDKGEEVSCPEAEVAE